jgi:hypothetical protein
MTMNVALYAGPKYECQYFSVFLFLLIYLPVCALTFIMLEYGM